MRFSFLSALVVLLSFAISPSAQAAFHLMKIVEVFPGSVAAPNAQYVQLQMYANGQNLVGSHVVQVFNAAGTLTQTFTFPGNVANGANQATIFIATVEAVAFFNLPADLTMTSSLPLLGGKVCFDPSPIDCVAWGNYSGSATGVGTPFNQNGLAPPGNPAIGLQAGRAMFRRLDIAGSPTVLDAADDTNDSANDFRFGTPIPRNNAGTFGTIPASTCGNNVIESLEQCDDGNLVSDDGCSSTCLIDINIGNIFANGFE